MGFCSATTKFLVFVFNFIFFLAGIAIIGLGAYMYLKMGNYFDFLGTASAGVGMSAIIFIIAGVVITIISFLGCWSACTNNTCMMYTFATIMAVILVAEIGVAIAILFYKGQVTEIVTEAMQKGLDHYGKDDADGVTRGWDKGQQELHCCGINSPDDWKNSTIKHKPDSCCVTQTKNCVAEGSPTFDDGCFVIFEKFIKDKIYWVGGVGIGIAIFQLIAIIASCCLGKKMRENENYV